MNPITYHAASSSECLAFARRSGYLAKAIAEKQLAKDPLAVMVLDLKVIDDVMEGRQAVPIPGLQITRSLEATNSNFSPYNPSLLVQAVFAFEEHVNGLFSSDTESRLRKLEADFFQSESGGKQA